MNILHISAVKNWGGGECHLENLYYELSQSNPEVKQTILCVNNGKFNERLKKTNFNVITAPLGIKLDLRFVFKIQAVCKSKKIDIIHIHDPTALTLTVISDRIFKTLPNFIYHKKTVFPIKNRKRTLFKYNYKKIVKMICVSKAVHEVSKNAIEDHSKLITIYDGIRLDNRKDHALYSLKEKYGIDDDKIIIGTICNHIRAKNLLTYVEVINEIVHKRKMKNFHFVQIGDFTDRSEMYFEKVKEYELENFVTFTGFLNEASTFIPQFDVFLLTSQSEAMGMVINEAFYYKVPVVSTNAGGIPEIIEHDVNGLLANIEDYKALSNHIITLVNDKEKVKLFVKKSHATLMNDFSTKIMSKKTLEVYRSILN